ncbi:uncharacterized protein [Littorina saxatilis]|uniref:PPM-type phosphatase domain-containing protein n=1 Tax=Littorina saxatilis TaxID=31220 RepID=A0AAN9AKB4_9CAEN
MTSHRIGVNLRVSGNCDQGGRKYMEDYHAIKFVKKDDRDYEFAYFGVFDGHGGSEASRFARDNLLNEITKYDQFWTDNDEDILFAIRSGFLDTHQAMWKELDKWPRTVSGLPSTSGTTASIAIIKKGRLYIGHVGDSGIVLGCDEGPRNAIFMKPKCLTKDHKPDNPEEKERIEKSGGSVVAKAGVQRVVWSRPKVNHKGPVRRSTQIDKIPFLAVARSLGDLWSYDYYKGQFVVSPDPDVSVMKIEPGSHRCLVFGSDGLWNMLSPAEAVSVVTDLEMHFEDRVIHDPTVSVSYWINPAEKLVTRALNKWRSKMMKADNISCIVVLIDPLGPSKLTILRKRREDHFLKLQEAKALANASRSNNASQSSPSTSALPPSKFNHNQNNLVGRENHGEGGAGGGREEAEEGNVENKTSSKGGEHKAKKSGGEESDSVAVRSDSGFTGRDITASSNQPHRGHSLRSASHSPEAGTKSLQKVASVSKVGQSIKGVHQADTTIRYPLLPRRLSHPSLTSRLVDIMDDSVQASSALVVSPAFASTLSPTSEDPRFPGSADDSEVGSPAHTLPPHMSMSESLFKLMNLDAVKASSDPVPKPSAVSVLNQAGKGSEVKDPRRQRRSAIGVLQNCALPQQHTSLLSAPSRQHTSLISSSAVDVNQTLPPTSSTLGKPFHSTRSLDNTFHSTRSLDKHAASSSRILRLATAQSSSTKPDKTQSQASHKDGLMPGKSLKMSGLVHTPGGTLIRKAKRRRDFGLLHRTRTTLRRARKAACKAFCPENRPFLKQLPGSKRKRDEKLPAPDTPSTKRLRRSDGLRCSV